MEQERESPVRQLFRGAGVFVTGSTGFLGQLLLEKLLRACPDVKTLFLLMRSKKGKTEAERFTEIFEGEVHESGSIETTYIDVAAREVWAVTPPHSKKMPDIPRSSKLEMATATSTEAQENRNFSKRSNPDSQSNTSFKYDLFECMKKACPDYKNKVRLVAGDCELPQLGLGDSDRELLCQEVNIVFHVAATVRFDQKLKTAVHINVRGTKHLLELARLMPHLQAFIHVSTAYANCPEKHIEERFYSVPLQCDTAIEMVELFQEDVLNVVTPKVLKDWPNTYTFTKSIAEDVVREFGKGLPVAVVRPSIVISTAREPFAGWINNIYGPTGAVMGAGLGILRTMHCNPDLTADIVPADMVINLMIATAWDVATRHRSNAEKLQHTELTKNLSTLEDDISILNYVSSTQNPITWHQYMKYSEVGTEYPSMKIMWYYCFQPHKHRIVHNLCTVFLHLLPALIVDIAARLAGKKPILLEAYKKIHKFVDVISYFCTQQWKFTDHNVQAVWSRMTPLDRELFDFNIVRLDWKSVLRSCMLGLCIYMLKESPDTIEAAKKRYRRLKIVHYFLVYFLRFSLLALITWFTISIVM